MSKLHTQQKVHFCTATKGWQHTNHTHAHTRAIGDTTVPGPESIPTPAHTPRPYRACVVENVHEQATSV